MPDKNKQLGNQQLGNQQYNQELDIGFEVDLRIKDLEDELFGLKSVKEMLDNEREVSNTVKVTINVLLRSGIIYRR